MKIPWKRWFQFSFVWHWMRYAWVQTRMNDGVFVLVLGCTLLWYLCNVFANVMAKSFLDIGTFPLTISLGVLLISAAFNAFIALLRGRSVAYLLRDDERNMAATVAALHAFGVLSGFISLSGLHVSFVNILKSSEPIFMVIAAYFLGAPIQADMFLCITTIFLGVSIASVKAVSFDLISLLSALLSTWCLSLRTLLTKGELDARLYHAFQHEKELAFPDELEENYPDHHHSIPIHTSVNQVPVLVEEKEGKKLKPVNRHPMQPSFHILTSMDLHFSMCWWGSVILFPIWLLFEARSFQFFVYDLYQHDRVEVILFAFFLVGGSLLTFLFNQFSFFVLSLVSEYTHAIHSCLKRAFVIVMSFLVYGVFPSMIQCVGTTISLMGVAWYTRLSRNIHNREQNGNSSFTALLYTGLIAVFLIAFAAFAMVGSSLSPNVMEMDAAAALQATTFDSSILHQHVNPKNNNFLLSAQDEASQKSVCHHENSPIRIGFLGKPQTREEGLGSLIRWQFSLALLRSVLEVEQISAHVIALDLETVSSAVDLDSLIIGNIPLTQKDWFRFHPRLMHPSIQISQETNQEIQRVAPILLFGPMVPSYIHQKEIPENDITHMKELLHFFSSNSLHGGVDSSHAVHWLFNLQNQIRKKDRRKKELLVSPVPFIGSGLSYFAVTTLFSQPMNNELVNPLFSSENLQPHWPLKFEHIMEVTGISATSVFGRKIHTFFEEGVHRSYILVQWSTPSSWDERSTLANVQYWIGVFSDTLLAIDDNILVVFYYGCDQDATSYQALASFRKEKVKRWMYFMEKPIYKPNDAIVLYAGAKLSFNMQMYGAELSAAVGTPMVVLDVAEPMRKVALLDFVRYMDSEDMLIKDAMLHPTKIKDIIRVYIQYGKQRGGLLYQKAKENALQVEQLLKEFLQDTHC